MMMEALRVTKERYRQRMKARQRNEAARMNEDARINEDLRRTDNVWVDESEEQDSD